MPVTPGRELGAEDVLRMFVILLPVAAGLLGLLVLLFALRRLRRQRREMELGALADELGLRPAPEQDGDERRWELCRFSLLRPSRSTRKEIGNRFQGTLRGAEVEVFDVYRTMNTRPDVNARPQALPPDELHAKKPDYPVDSKETAVLVRRPGMDLPAFLLVPDSPAKRFLDGRRHEQPEDAFEDRNAIDAHDAEAVEALFAGELRVRLADNTDLTVEGRGEQLLAYRESRVLRPAQLRELLDEAVWMAEQLDTASGQ